MDPNNQQHAFAASSQYGQPMSPYNMMQANPQMMYQPADYYNILSSYPGIFPINAPLSASQSMMYAAPSRLMSVSQPVPAQNIMQSQPAAQPAQWAPAATEPEGEEERKEGAEKKESSKRKTADGRVYKCTKCDKSYLSYPALYTHTKLKHLHSGESPSITNGRTRGRPRKVVVCLCLRRRVEHRWHNKRRPNRTSLLQNGGKTRRTHGRSLRLPRGLRVGLCQRQALRRLHRPSSLSLALQAVQSRQGRSVRGRAPRGPPGLCGPSQGLRRAPGGTGAEA